MTVFDFLTVHALCPEQIPAEECLGKLLEEMELGLRGQGRIPMLPSYLSASILPPRNSRCCVLDAGGTNLRAGLAVFDEDGVCHIHHLQQGPMPGTQGPVSAGAFYDSLANWARNTGETQRIGLCFSYNVLLERHLDGILEAWCKEVQVPEAVGRPVGKSLQEALGPSGGSVHVLNDSVAAMLGASSGDAAVQVGIILGTGINVCYEERCDAIPKVERDLRGDSMIISTEVGEFDGIPKSDLDLALFAATEEPELAHGEKQCAGAYLGDLICRAWQAAAGEGLLGDAFSRIRCTLPQISDMLDGKDAGIPADADACRISETLIHRAAKIAAVLCAGPVLRCGAPGGEVRIAVEGSQFRKLHGFREYFRQELETLLRPRNIGFTFVETENACLKGAALGAYAEPM